MGDILNAIHFTDWLILGTLAAIVLVDLALVFMEADTISHRFRNYGRRWSSFPFSWGVLGGHFWGPPGDPAGGSWLVSISALIACALSTVVVHRVLRLNFNVPAWFVVFWILPGVAAGAALWPQ